MQEPWEWLNSSYDTGKLLRCTGFISVWVEEAQRSKLKTAGQSLALSGNLEESVFQGSP